MLWEYYLVSLGGSGAAVHQPTGARRALLTTRKLRACTKQRPCLSADFVGLILCGIVGRQRRGGPPALRCTTQGPDSWSKSVLHNSMLSGVLAALTRYQAAVVQQGMPNH